MAQMPNEIDQIIHESVHQIQTKKRWITCSILLLVNLLNYMDRFTIVGVMGRLTPYFGLNDQLKGLLQTVFIVFYLVFAPLFGYLGDRYNRKMLMIMGISIWILAVFASSFCTENHYYIFLLFRGVVGIGEASYSTLAPTVLSDLFSGSLRSRVLMMFYFAIPVGSGFGFIAGSRISLATDSWQWGVRFSPLIGIGCLALMAWLLEEPVRGSGDGARQNRDDATLWDDIKYLLSVKTFYLATFASVAAFFSIGTMSWWTPLFVGYAYAVIEKLPEAPPEKVAHIDTIFGVITAVAGLFGVATGSVLSRAWRDGKSIFRNNPSEKADVYICALSMFLALPFLFFAIFLADYNITLCLVLIYFAIMSMCLNWAVNVDVLLYVVVANRRATALALQTMVAHLFGDASSPYIIGLLSDHIRGPNVGAAAHFYALQKALYLPTFMLVLAGAFYLAATFFVEQDRKEALFQMDATDNWDHLNRSDDSNPLFDGSTHQPETVEGVVEHPAIITHSLSQTNSSEAGIVTA